MEPAEVRQEKSRTTFGTTRPQRSYELGASVQRGKVEPVPEVLPRWFAFLPFLWLVNIFWFFREAFLVPAYTEQSQIKGYVWRSAVGFLFWVIVLTTWITIFQIYRPRWGALGDYLSFTIPLGTP
ncbi:gamma-secretase subunit PEN-2 isoform X1 [Pteropus medius]|uniref:gamma-secretase subunit PEN-2 isoform X1 n=1 Tax=Pteropus vampyrus TaxID=132908 RepID=UPI00196A1F3C|nr:gamma-secretase subunit PEN-2 isoform X1 [Pteropus giganteus]